MFTIANQTHSTFINAFTASTSYPVSSMSEEQLLKLAEVYLDCVYYPSVYADSNIFLREAWRYEMADEADISAWAKTSVQALVASGVAKLDADGNYHPKGDVTASFVQLISTFSCEFFAMSINSSYIS